MEVTELTLKLIFLLTPGAIASIIYLRLTVRDKEFTNFQFLVSSILYGLFSYLLLQTIISLNTILCNNLYCQNQILSNIKTFERIAESTFIPYNEIIYASLLGIILGFIAVKIDHCKLLNKIAKKLNLSNKYGDENLFSFFLNSSDISWVYIRDIPNALTYFGTVSSFSENQATKEIVLNQVTVFNYPDSEELYEVDRVYLCYPKDQLIIEQAKFLTNGEEKSKPKA